MTTFYLHEDDWGMINLLPAENAAWAGGVAREAQRASEENFAGVVPLGEFQIPTYHDIYVIPEQQHPISERAIRLDALRELLSNTWPEAQKINSGYSSHMEELSGSFAFGEAQGGMGAFHGRHQDDIVLSLNITRPAMDDVEAIDVFGAALSHLGKQYELMLVDWWTRKVLDLHEVEGIRRYLAGEI